MIRIRHPQGASSFQIDDTTAWHQLESFLSGLVKVEDYELRTGYPPKPIDTSSLTPSSLLSQPPLSIKRGDQLILAPKALPNGGVAPSSRPNQFSPLAFASSSSSKSQPSNVPSFNASSATAVRGAPPQHRAGSVPDGVGGMSRSQQVAMRAYAESSAAAASASSPGSNSQPKTSAGSAAGSKGSVQDGEVYVRLPSTGEHLTLKVVPDDNSCLFHAVAVLFHQKTGLGVCKELRQVVSQGILASPKDYPEVVLGMPPYEYARKISEEKTWGGAIELSLLSNHFNTELVSLDVSTGVTYRFGESASPPHSQIGYLIHSGIHYDSLVLLPAEVEPSPGQVPLDFARTLFSRDEQQPLDAVAKEMVAKLKARHYHTDTATFDLRCGTCGSALVGEKGASRHAMETGHTDFREA